MIATTEHSATQPGKEQHKTSHCHVVLVKCVNEIGNSASYDSKEMPVLAAVIARVEHVAYSACRPCTSSWDSSKHTVLQTETEVHAHCPHTWITEGQHEDAVLLLALVAMAGVERGADC